MKVISENDSTAKIKIDSVIEVGINGMGEAWLAVRQGREAVHSAVAISIFMVSL